MCRWLSTSSAPVGVNVDDRLADEIGRIIIYLVDSPDVWFADVLAILVEPVHGDGHNQDTLFAGFQELWPKVGDGLICQAAAVAV